MINAAKYDNRGYYPFTLSLKVPFATYAFYAGILKIVVFIDFKFLVDKLALQNLAIEYLEDPNYSLKVTNANDHKSSNEFSEAYVGKHFFDRLFFEFMSLEWFIEELIYGVHNKMQWESDSLRTNLAPEEIRRFFPMLDITQYEIDSD